MLPSITVILQPPREAIELLDILDTLGFLYEGKPPLAYSVGEREYLESVNNAQPQRKIHCTVIPHTRYEHSSTFPFCFRPEHPTTTGDLNEKSMIVSLQEFLSILAYNQEHPSIQPGVT
jgi:hypothetical protein